MSRYTLFVILFFIPSFIFDVSVGLGRVPVVTAVLCGIVLIYEFVSPYIYSSR